MINILDEYTVSKIAAGEIIENPASIVKELLENSIDAGAKNITVEVKGGVSNYIRVSDDGSGIEKDDLKFAFLRHATSKLKTSDDLFNIHSLGFRGEALASISNISKLTCITKTGKDQTATVVEVENGEIKSEKSIASNEGTTFIIEDIFYNTPVRKKYLKSENLEFSYIFDVVEKLSLSRSDISFTLIRDGKVVVSSISNENLKNHIHSVLGSDITRNLVEIEHEEDGYKIKGFISNNMLYRSTRNHEYLFVNGRFVKNLEVARAIEKSYKSLIPLNRFPVYLLYIEIDPKLVDVNIHPKKHEIKLSNENRLIEILESLIKKKLYKNTEIFKVDFEEKEEKSIFEEFEIKSEDSWYVRPSQGKNIDTEFIKVIDGRDFETEEIYDELEIDSKEEYFSKKENEATYENISFNVADSLDEYEVGTTSILKDLLNSTYKGSLFKTYLIFESYEDKFYIVDQHAAHERINYEKFKKEFEEKKIERQVLLSPMLVEVTSEERKVLLENTENLKNLGFYFEEFGEKSFLLREIPIIFGKPSGLNFIHELLSDSYDNLYQVDPYKIMTKACKASVKAGDNLSIEEINELIKLLSKCENPLTCPHGRPTILELKKYDLERLFLRWKKIYW